MRAKVTKPLVNVRKGAADGPVLVPDSRPAEPKLPRRGVVGLALLGAALGAATYQAVRSGPDQPTVVVSSDVATYEVQPKAFVAALRAGGTVGATESAMIRAPRMRGSRDRGGGGGGAGGPGGGGSLTIETLAEGGSTVKAGEVVAVFESKRTADILDDYQSNLAQTKRRTASRKADLLISTETLRQNLRKAQADADKAQLDLGTAEVKSEIQAEILALQAEQHRASAEQLREEVRLTEVANDALERTLEIDVERAEIRLERTEGDLEKMRLRTPVPGLVVIESMFQRDQVAQAAAGDTVNPGSYFLRIVDLSEMAVFAHVNQADAQLVEIGSPAEVRLDAYPDAVFEGQVTAIGAVAVAAGSSGGGGRGSRGTSRSSGGRWVRQVPVEVAILSADERIKPDLSASVDIQLSSRENALVIPRAAVGTEGDRDVVWVQDGDAFVERPVTVDLLSDTEVTVVNGLSAGEVIAAQPVAPDATMVAAGM